jgi:hypothetical protein
MPRVGFEPKIPGYEREKTVDDLDYEATVIGRIRQVSSEITIYAVKKTILKDLYLYED